MSDEKNKNTMTWYIGKVILITLLMAFIVRLFFVDSITISSTQMESSLIKGDRVFVDKTAYGIRLPMTLLSIPFTFDSILGMKSYLEYIELKYRRLSSVKVNKGDVVLFNNPMESNKPLDKRSLLVSRCVASSGDLVNVEYGVLIINEVEYVHSPDLIQNYKIGYPNDSIFIDKSIDKEAIKSILKKYKIPLRSYKETANTYVELQLSRYEAFMFNQNSPESLLATITDDERADNYSIEVPSKGMKIDLDKFSVAIYAQSIQQEQAEEGVAVVLKNDSLYLNDEAQKEYTFKENYLWLLSDNQNNGIDSRSIGFIPFSHIVGKVGYIWSGSSSRVREFNRNVN